MSKFISKNNIASFLLGVAVILVIAHLHNNSSYRPGTCIEGLDGYLWHINRYESGSYYAMGWQQTAWGNEVEVGSEVFEGNSPEGIPRYHQQICPEYGSR